MLKPKNDLLQGTLALLVLKTLARGPLHRLRHHSSYPDGFKGLPARRGRLLYPRSTAWSRTAWVTAEWGFSENNRRARYYHLTAAAGSNLRKKKRAGKRLIQAVAQVLRFA